MNRATIIDRVTRDMRLFHEESCGPIVGVTRVSTDEQAVSVANDSAYGLTAAVFGRDLTRALAVAQRIEAGICHINSSSLQDEPQMPFGGVKASGFGRFGGRGHSRIHRPTVADHRHRAARVSRQLNLCCARVSKSPSLVESSCRPRTA